MVRKLLVFAVMLVLATGMLFACSGEQDQAESSSSEKSSKTGKTKAGQTKTEPVDAVQVAYKKTVAEQTARMKFSMVTSGIPTGTNNQGSSDTTSFRMNGGGVMELSGQKARMTLKMGPLGSFEMRMFDTTIYQKMPRQMRAEMPGMKPWIKSDLDDFYEQQYGTSYSEIQANNPTDPTQQLQALREVGSVEKVGQEKVRGAGTTHYRAVMDFEKVAAQQGPEGKKAYKEMVEQMGTSKVPTHVWIDEQGRARKFQMDMTTTVPVPADPTADPAAGGATTEEKIRVVMVQEIFDFGVPVNVSPPPAEKTMTQGELESLTQKQMDQQQAAAKS